MAGERPGELGEPELITQPTIIGRIKNLFRQVQAGAMHEPAVNFPLGLRIRVDVVAALKPENKGNSQDQGRNDHVRKNGNHLRNSLVSSLLYLPTRSLIGIGIFSRPSEGPPRPSN